MHPSFPERRQKCDTPIYIEALELWLEAVLLDGAPPVLSTGKLCRENNCKFEQDGEELPRIFVKDSDGEIIREVILAVAQDCPIIFP